MRILYKLVAFINISNLLLKLFFVFEIFISKPLYLSAFKVENSEIVYFSGTVCNREKSPFQDSGEAKNFLLGSKKLLSIFIIFVYFPSETVLVLYFLNLL